MILEVNEENFELLAISACPIDFQSKYSNDNCLLLDDESYYGVYNGSAKATCRACWLKWLFKENEDKHE